MELSEQIKGPQDEEHLSFCLQDMYSGVVKVSNKKVFNCACLYTCVKHSMCCFFMAMLNNI